MRLLKYLIGFVLAVAPIAAIASLIGTFFGLGGWGWLLFLWFGFTGMFSLGLLKQEVEKADQLFVSGLAILLMTAFAGGVYFALSDLPRRISIWYALLTPLIVFALLALKAQLASTKSRQSNALAEFSREVESWPRDQARTALLLIRATIAGAQKQIVELYPDLTVGQLKSVEQVLRRIEAEGGVSRV
jgi:hypothetical protein